MLDSFAELAETLSPGSRPISARPLKGGISAGMTALTIEHANRRREQMVVRVQGQREYAYDPEGLERMFRILQTLAPRFPVVPAPIYLDAAGDLFGSPCLVMQRIHGDADCTLAFGPVFTAGASIQLMEIHNIPAAVFDFLPDFTDRVQRHLDQPPEVMDDTLRESEIRMLLTANFPFKNPNRKALLHGDYWPGNLLWEGDRLVGVVDWEETALGDPLADLAIARLDILFVFGRKSMDDFTQRFLAASTAVDPADLPYWDLYAALRPAGNLAAWAEGWPAFGRPDVTLETMQADQGWFIQNAIERL